MFFPVIMFNPIKRRIKDGINSIIPIKKTIIYNCQDESNIKFIYSDELIPGRDKEKAQTK